MNDMKAVKTVSILAMAMAWLIPAASAQSPSAASATVAGASPFSLGAPGLFAGFQVNGPPGASYEIQCANSLANPIVWASLAQIVVTNAGQVFVDTSAPATSQTARFYRILPLANCGPQGMVWMPPGTFTMGSPSTDPDHESAESPQTEVALPRGFWMAKHETTQAEYQSLMGNNPSYFTGDPQRPVEMVSWHEATNYCGKLTARERDAGRLPAGYVYRLPTEAEWEYACRGGTSTRFGFGNDSGYTSLGNYEWYAGNSGGQTHPVGQKLPNARGLHDLQGNVWEWCQDWYSNSLPGGSVVDPKGPLAGPSRVFRGGCWDDSGCYCRLASRYGFNPNLRIYYLGFRPVLAAAQ